MFDGPYFDWIQKRVKAIIDFYGYNFFLGKQVLDLGCGHADISGALYRLGSSVTAVDARQEHLNVVNKKFPGIKTVRSDLDQEWTFSKFDVIVDMGLLSHLRNYESHLRCVCASTKYLILETAVLDGEESQTFTTGKIVYNGSLSGTESQITASKIESILKECGMTFKRLDAKKLNSGKYVYDWSPKSDGIFDNNKRRIWFAEKINTDVPIPKPVPSFTPPPPNKIIHDPSPQIVIPPKPSIEFHGKKLKVALCLSGFTRDHQYCLPSLHMHLFNNPELDIDVFIHTWTIANRNNVPIDQPALVKRYKPVRMVVEPPMSFAVQDFHSKNHDRRDLNGLMSMFYKIEACNNLKKQYEQENNFIYDAVIRFRFDLRLDSQFLLSNKTNLSKLQIPKWGDFGGINDQVAFSSSANMDKYSTLYSNFRNILSALPTVNPEVMMKRHIQLQRLEVERPEIDYIIWYKRTNNKDWERKQGFIR